MNEKLNHNVTLFLRCLKELHVIDTYYNDFMTNKIKNKINIIKILQNNPSLSPEEFIGQAYIFPIWTVSEKKRIFWLDIFKKIKKIQADKILTDFLLFTNKNKADI